MRRPVRMADREDYEVVARAEVARESRNCDRWCLCVITVLLTVMMGIGAALFAIGARSYSIGGRVVLFFWASLASLPGICIWSILIWYWIDICRRSRKRHRIQHVGWQSYGTVVLDIEMVPVQPVKPVWITYSVIPWGLVTPKRVQPSS
jgi:hypothetical protein